VGLLTFISLCHLLGCIKVYFSRRELKADS